MVNDPDERLLARNMIEVHGAEAAVIARGNARSAALAGQPMQARSWIRVLDIIQRQADKASKPPGASNLSLPAPNTVRGS